MALLDLVLLALIMSNDFHISLGLFLVVLGLYFLTVTSKAHGHDFEILRFLCSRLDIFTLLHVSFLSSSQVIS